MSLKEDEDYVAALSESERERVVGLVSAELAKHPVCEGCRVAWDFGVFVLTGGRGKPGACRATVFMPVVREVVARHRIELERDG